MNTIFHFYLHLSTLLGLFYIYIYCVRKSISLLVLSCVLMGYSGYSQQIKVVRDFGFWAGCSFEKNLSDDLCFKLEQQIRTFHNASKLDSYLLDARVFHPINKHFVLGGNLRYIYNVKGDAYVQDETEHNIRYNLDLKYKRKPNQIIKFHYRLRYQHELVNFYKSFFNHRQQTVRTSAIRNKIKLFYKYSDKHHLHTSAELFRLIVVFREPYFNKFRLCIGDELNSEIGVFDYSIGFEREIGSINPYSFFYFKTIYKFKK